jgi:hypothetical protein
MNRDKAREFFSAYAEGTLDEGLKQSFELRLQNDPELSKEYQAFETTYRALDSMKSEAIHVPADLHERISARLDRQIWEQKQNAAPAWKGWLRNLGFAGIAGLAILGGVLALRGGPSQTVGAGMSGSGSQSGHLITESKGNVVKAKYLSGRDMNGTVDGPMGRQQLQIPRGTPWESTFENKQPGAAIFRVKMEGDVETTVVAIPGSSPSAVASGQGDLDQMLKSAADFYNTPIVARVTGKSVSYKWEWKEGNAFDSLSNAIDNRGSVQKKSTGLEITIN